MVEGRQGGGCMPPPAHHAHCQLASEVAAGEYDLHEFSNKMYFIKTLILLLMMMNVALWQ
jgi:hypothetical protein